MSRTIKTILPPRRQGSGTLVLFTDGTSLRLVPPVADEGGLYPGMVLEDGELAALEAANGAASAKQRAVRIISTVGVTKQELARRLTRKGETPADAENAVRWLEELDLLDDAQIARQIVARGVARGYGAQRIKQMLYEKRVPREYWEEALETMPDMSEALLRFLQKRLGPEPDERTKQNACAAAIRRGYTWSEVNQALCQLGSEA